MAFNVQTDHQFIAFGDNFMAMFDVKTGEQLVAANRPDPATGIWIINASGLNDIEVQQADDDKPRKPVLDAMQDHYLISVQPDRGTYAELSLSERSARLENIPGFSHLIPHGLPETP
jgi:hypothetical protein